MVGGSASSACYGRWITCSSKGRSWRTRESETVVRSRGRGCPLRASGGEELLERRMGAHEYPRGIEFVDEQPMTPTGEVRSGVPRRRGEARA